MSSRLFGLLFVLACSVAAIPAVVTDGSEVSATAEFSQDWIVVRLDRPIGEPGPDGSFVLETGFRGVDALIRDLGIWRIEHALPVSSRDPADPEAFRRWGFDRTYKFFVPSRVEVPKLVKRFAGAAGVDFAEPDYRLRGSAIVPNDTFFGDQWGLENTGQSGGTPGCDVSAPEAWELSTGRSVIIAVSDTGIDSNHPDFLCPGKVVEGYDFVDFDPDPEDTHGHGTQVSSVAAACTDNEEGIAGACWSCSVMPIRVTSPFGSTFADAMVWAVDHGARVVNNSNGQASESSTALSVSGYVYDAGVVQVASSGNDNTAVYYPAAHAETIAVGATDDLDQWSSPMCGQVGYASNFGPELDVVAPGEYTPLADMGGGYREDLCGTSYAAPLVSGLVGLIESIYPSAGRDEVKHLVRAGADDQVGRPAEDTPGFDDYHGWGRVNMERTLLATEAAVTLRVEGKGATRLYYETPVGPARSYDFARGDLAALSESHMGVDAGNLTCIENDSADADTVGAEDTAIPEPGEGFFYLARFATAAGAGSYGGSTKNRDRLILRHQAEADWFVDGDRVFSQLGRANSAGDVNGDGYADLVVGAPYWGNGSLYHAGMAAIYLGSPTGLASSPYWSSYESQMTANYGYSVARAGDVNGDGFDDVIIGSYGKTGPVGQAGAAFVYFGDPVSMSTTPDWSVFGDQVGSRFGDTVSSAGDVNGDGYDDVLVGTQWYDAGQINEGRIFLYYGSPSGPSMTADWMFESDQTNGYLAFQLSPGGDINGDGYDDIVVGSDGYDGGETDEGRVFVFYGSPSGPATTPNAWLELDIPNAWFGAATSGAGDVNHDGYDDVVVCASNYSGGQTSEGAVFLFLGSAAGITTTPSWSFEADQAFARIRYVQTAGDLNDDGYDDVVASAYRYDELRTDEGRAWLFLGSPGGLEVAPVWSVTGAQSGAWFGRQVGTTGDVNGDGYADVFVGSERYDSDEIDKGRVFVYHGPLADLPAQSDCPR